MKRFYNNTLIGGAFSKALRVVALLCVLLGVSNSAMGANVEVVLWKSGQSSNNYNIESATCNIEITTAGDYYFYISDYGNQKKLNNYQQMNSSNCTNFNFNGTSSDCGLKVAEGETGTFTFKIQWSGSTPIVSVVYPTSGGGGDSGDSGDSGDTDDCQTIYLKPNIWGAGIDEHFYAHFWDSSNNTKDIKLKKAENCDGIFYIGVEKNYTNVIFVRKNPSSDASNIWDGVWNQTINLTISGSNNLYTINNWNNGEGGNSTGSWSTSNCNESDCSGGSGDDDDEDVSDGTAEFSCEDIEIWCRTENGNLDMWCYAWTNNNTELLGPWRGSQTSNRGEYDGQTYAVWTITGHEQINVIFSSDSKNTQTGDLSGYKKGNRVIFTINENYNGTVGDIKQIKCAGGEGEVVNNGTIYLDIANLDGWDDAGAILKVKVTYNDKTTEEIDLTQCATENTIFFVDQIIDLNTISKINMLRYNDAGSGLWNETGDITFNTSTNCVKLTSWNNNYANYSLTGYSGACGVAGASPVLIANEAIVGTDGLEVTLSGYLQETFCEAITEYGFIYCGGSATKGCEPTKNSPKIKVSPTTQLYRGEIFTATTKLAANTTYGYKAYVMVGGIMYISAETGYFTLGDCTTRPTNESTIVYTVDASMGESWADPCTLTFGNLQTAIDHLTNANSPLLGLYQYVEKDGDSYNLKQPVIMNVVYYDDTPNDETRAYTYRGTKEVGKYAGDTKPKNSNLIENINLTQKDDSRTLTIKAGNNIAKPWIHHIVLRKSRNIVLDSLCIYSDPKDYDATKEGNQTLGDNALEMDINVASGRGGWNALNNQSGVGIKDNYLDNANILIKNCMIGSNGFTGLHISSYNGITFKNNDFESVFDQGTNNDINYGASAKFLYCKNIKFIQNNFRGDHATLMWIQECQNMLVMNNVFWNTNKYQQASGTHVPAAMRVVTQWNPTNNIGFYYNTYYFADNGNTWSNSKYNFLHFSHTVDGGSGSYNLGTMYFKYNNCYSYDVDCPGDEDISITGNESNFCPNNFWSQYDEDKGNKTSVFAFGCSDNEFTNVKGQVCKTTASSPASLVVKGKELNNGVKPSATELSNIGISLSDQELHSDRYFSNVREGDSGWTYGAYQSKENVGVEKIYWRGKNSDWDDRNNWEYEVVDPETKETKRIPTSCINTFSENLEVVIEEVASIDFSDERNWPVLPDDFDSGRSNYEYNEHVSAGADGKNKGSKFAEKITVEYGAGIIGVENLVNGSRHYGSASMEFIAPRKQWILVGTVVKPYDDVTGEARNVKSGDYFITGQTPHVYMHKAEIVGDKAKWDETFTSLETFVEPNTVFAIQVPDQYGKYKLPARYFNKTSSIQYNPDEPIQYGTYAGSKGPFKGDFVNESSLPTYTGLTAGTPVLLNNSYPANIDARVLETVSGGTVQYYDYESGTFLNTSSTSEKVLLKPQHGFIFTPATGKTSLTIENIEGMFVNGNTRSRSAEVDYPTLSLNVVNANTGTAYGNAVVRYDDLVMAGEESPANVEKVFSPNLDAPELYIIANDKMYSRLDVNPNTKVIPLGVRLKQDMNIKFVKEYFKNFNNATLVDTYTGKQTDLLRNSYTTETLVAGDIEGRFYLNLELSANVEDDNEGEGDVSTEVEEDSMENAINIYVDESDVIRVVTNGVELKVILVSDMAGRTMRYDVRGYAANLKLPVAQGVYTINVIGDTASRTEKVILR